MVEEALRISLLLALETRGSKPERANQIPSKAVSVWVAISFVLDFVSVVYVTEGVISQREGELEKRMHVDPI